MNNYTIISFRGGISDENSWGPRGSGKFFQNCDIHKKRDSLSCQQAMKKESGGIVIDLILFMVAASDGNSYHFGNTGRIYKRTPAGVWSLIYTDSNGRINGAEEYNGYIYWTTDIRLNRKPFPGASDWSDVVIGWQTLNSADWHTMIAGSNTAGMMGGNLFICNSDKIAMVDEASVFTSEAVRLTPDVISKTLLSDDNYLIIGTVKKDNAEEGYLFAWNSLIMNWKKRKKIPVKGINGLVLSEIIIAQAGAEGGLFYSDLVHQMPIISIPGGGYVNPGGLTTKGNLALFGFYGSTVKNGIYSFGRVAKNRSFALNLEYIPSPANVDEIGAIKTINGDLLVSWKSGSSYGVDTIDKDNKASGIFESLEFDAGSSYLEKLFSQVKIKMTALPTNCSLKLKYKLNNVVNWTETKTTDNKTEFNTAGETTALFNIQDKGETLELRVELYPSNNNTPEILAINTYFDGLDIF